MSLNTFLVTQLLRRSVQSIIEHADAADDAEILELLDVLLSDVLDKSTLRKPLRKARLARLVSNAAAVVADSYVLEDSTKHFLLNLSQED